MVPAQYEDEACVRWGMKPFAALLAVAGLVSTAMGTIKTVEVPYEHGGVKLRGYFAYDDAALAKAGGKLPAVLIAPEWWGTNEYVKMRARKFAEMGYAAMAIDMYGDGVLAKDAGEAGKLAGKFYEADPKTGVRSLMRERAGAGLSALLAQAQVDGTRVAAVGYCFGGTIALELARGGADLKGVISYHGGLATPGPEKDKWATGLKVLVCHGADDPMVKPEEVARFQDEMREGKIDYQIVMYSGAVHAFTNPEAGTGPSKGLAGVAYNEKADRRSWELTKTFLGEVLR